MGKATLEDIWNTSTKKLLVWVKEGRDLAAKDRNGFSDPYLKLSFGKQSNKTSIVKKTLNPVFPSKEIFYFEDDGSDFTVELWDHDTLSRDDFMGTVRFGKLESAFPEEKVVDKWYTLESRPGKKDRVSGSIRLICYYSIYPETHPAQYLANEHAFYYPPYINHFKTGDLIVYEGIGLLDSLQKITSSSEFSRVGMIVRLPNKWTHAEECYILEVTRNLEGFLDVYKEVKGYGVCIFRAQERLHQVNAHKIHYVPLSQPFPHDLQRKIIESIATSHSHQTFVKSNRLEGIPMLTKENPTVISLLESLDKYLVKQDLFEFFSAQFISNFFKQVGIELFVDCGSKRLFSPSDVVTSGWFEKPILLRCKAKDVVGDAVMPKLNESGVGYFNDYTQNRRLSVSGYSDLRNSQMLGNSQMLNQSENSQMLSQSGNSQMLSQSHTSLNQSQGLSQSQVLLQSQDYMMPPNEPYPEPAMSPPPYSGSSMYPSLEHVSQAYYNAPPQYHASAPE